MDDKHNKDLDEAEVKDYQHLMDEDITINNN